LFAGRKGKPRRASGYPSMWLVEVSFFIPIILKELLFILKWIYCDFKIMFDNWTHGAMKRVHEAFDKICITLIIQSCIQCNFTHEVALRDVIVY